MTTSLKSIKCSLNKFRLVLKNFCSSPEKFAKNPGVDFSRKRKISAYDVISTILCMTGGTIAKEIEEYFGAKEDIVSTSAFIQQRNKFAPEAFRLLLHTIVDSYANLATYKGHRVLAVDGSDLQIPTDKENVDSYFAGSPTQSPYNLEHIDALYDVLNKIYLDASFVGKHKVSETAALCLLVERSNISDALVLADRGYENYNVMAHILEKGWMFLIRVKNADSNGIAFRLGLPVNKAFDKTIVLHLTRSYRKQAKALYKTQPNYKHLSDKQVFDYLPLKNDWNTPAVWYDLPIRIVCFEIGNGTFETIITSLDAEEFPAMEIKRLYNMRWGIETSFRSVKYTMGMLYVHSKKMEYIFQEIYARFIMYNFTQIIISHITIERGKTKYRYTIEFTSAFRYCRQLFLGNISPKTADVMIRKRKVPLRPNRKHPRIHKKTRTFSFTYRLS